MLQNSVGIAGCTSDLKSMRDCTWEGVGYHILLRTSQVSRNPFSMEVESGTIIIDEQQKPFAAERL